MHFRHAPARPKATAPIGRRRPARHAVLVGRALVAGLLSAMAGTGRSVAGDAPRSPSPPPAQASPAKRSPPAPSSSTEAKKPDPVATVDGRTVEQWRARLADPSATVRCEAAWALGKFGAAAAPAAAALVGVLDDGDRDVRWYGALALAGIGPTVSENADVGKAAGRALAKRLSDDDAGVRYWAATALSKIGAPVRDAVGDLAKALDDRDWRVRRAAVGALRSAGESAAPAVAGLAGLLSQIDDNEQNVSQLVRGEAAGVLGLLGARAAAAVPALKAAAADDPHGPVREAAAEALRLIAADAASRTKPPAGKGG